MHVGGRRPAQRLVQQVVLRGGGQILVAAHHVGDAHQVVVDHVGEVVGGQAVRLDQHVVVQRVAVHLHVAVDHVVEARLALGGDVLADDPGLARVQLRLDLLPGQVQAVLVVLEGLALLLGRLAAGVQALLGAEAVIGVAGFHQLFGEGHVGVLALGLHIGAAGAAHVRTLVVAQPGGGHGFVDDLHRAGDLALLVGVLDAQYELAPGAAGIQIGVQRGAQVAQVHVARGAGGESGANVHRRHSLLCHNLPRRAAREIIVLFSNPRPAGPGARRSRRPPGRSRPGSAGRRRPGPRPGRRCPPP